MRVDLESRKSPETGGQIQKNIEQMQIPMSPTIRPNMNMAKTVQSSSSQSTIRQT